MFANNEDDREEGEIVDDGLEEISDNPIIEPSFTGKCLSPKEHLRAISLSSVSDEEIPRQRVKKRRRSRRCSAKYGKKRKNHRRPSYASDSDSSCSVEICGVIQNPFKAAVVREDANDCPNDTSKSNSLQERLKAMARTVSAAATNSEDNLLDSQNEEPVESKQPSATESKEDDNEDKDSELIQLRLEALKTAFMNKIGSRKKRKSKDIHSGDSKLVTDETEINKENTLDINNIDDPNKIVEKINSIDDILAPDEDPDVLRAQLLASMTKKIIESKPEPSPIPMNITVKVNNVRKTFINKPVVTKQKNNYKVSHVTKNKSSTTVINKPIKLPEVKPLIINVNKESDSDEETDRPATQKNKNSFENTIEQFLKEQRAKVEAEHNQKVLSVSKNAVTPTLKTQVKTTIKNLPKLNISNINDKTPISKTKKSPIVEKSAVKLLPKSKQLEYQRLLLKLKTAERKTRIRRTSLKLNSDTVKNTPTQKINTIRKLNKTKIVPLQRSPISITNDRKNEALKLHKTLKDMQIEKNGRFQIQEKYKVLTPLMKKINEASKDRKKCDQEVKRLLEELTEAKRKQAKSQENFSLAIRDLYTQKERIDKSKQIVKKVIPSQLTASKPTVVANTSKVNGSISKTPEVGKPSIVEVEIKPVAVEINYGDPNDIDLIINKQMDKGPDKIPKYVSPLDPGRVETFDPFSIMCPFEIDGLCKDQECTYKHYLR